MNEIEKRENALKALCLRELDRQYGTLFFAMTLQDVRKSGYPDVVPSALGKTTWWEFKHATPRFSSPGIQNYTCRRLAQRSYCRYVIYHEDKDEQRTAIYHPNEIHKAVRGRLDGLTPEIEWRGFAHTEVAQFMYFAHGGTTAPYEGPNVLRGYFVV